MSDESTGLQGAADRIRETAKWFAVSVAALGGVVAAGSQLTDIGKLDPASDRMHFAVGAAAVAVAGALVILWAVVNTMTVRAVSLHTTAQKAPSGARNAVTDPTLLAGHPSVSDIETEYLGAVKARRTAYEEARARPGDQDKITVANLADNRFVAIDQVVSQLLDVVSYEHLARRWRNARIGIVIGAVASAVGLGVFAWAANPPPDAAASNAAANVLTTPRQGQVRLTAAGMAALEESVGTSCWTRLSGATPGPSASNGTGPAVTLQVLVLATTDAGPDVVIEQSGCNVVRVLLGTQWGTLTQ